MTLLPISGYVLAGGHSSRMGRDKALVELAGKPLIAHAVAKLRRLCTEVHILAGAEGEHANLAKYAPLVHDLHPVCGPVGGFEAALKQSSFDWNLFLPVDMPFLPSALLDDWLQTTLEDARSGARIALFTVDNRPQGTLALLRRELLPYLADAIESQRLKVFPVLEQAGRELAAKQGMPLETVFRNLCWGGLSSKEGKLDPLQTTEAQQAAEHLWFANLNTPADLVEAEANLDALEP
jgi:molybdopterin-guanine dinucleotide biosynthesis protein A